MKTIVLFVVAGAALSCAPPVGGEGEGEGEEGEGEGGHEVEPNGEGERGASVVVLVVRRGGSGAVTGEVGHGDDGVDIVSVDLAAGRWQVRLRCDAPSDADLDLFAGDQSSETQECDESIVVDVSAGVLPLRVLAFSGETGWTLELTPAPEEACEGEVCFGDCTDTSSDEDNCGGCNVACADNESCVDGACALQVNEQCNPFLDQCVPGACCISGFCQVAGGC